MGAYIHEAGEVRALPRLGVLVGAADDRLDRLRIPAHRFRPEARARGFTYVGHDLGRGIDGLGVFARLLRVEIERTVALSPRVALVDRRATLLARRAIENTREFHLCGVRLVNYAMMARQKKHDRDTRRRCRTRASLSGRVYTSPRHEDSQSKNKQEHT